MIPDWLPQDVKDFLDEIWVFRHGATLVRGIYAGTHRSRGTKVSFIYRIGLDEQKCYDVNDIRFLSKDIAPWSSEELRLKSLWEFNDVFCNPELSKKSTV